MVGGSVGRESSFGNEVVAGSGCRAAGSEGWQEAAADSGGWERGWQVAAAKRQGPDVGGRWWQALEVGRRRWKVAAAEWHALTVGKRRRWAPEVGRGGL